MRYKYIFWDFNGTIIDDVDIGIEAVNLALEARGLKPVATVEHYKEQFDFPIKDYYIKLGFDFAKEPYEKAAHEWFANYDRLSPKIKPVEGVVEAVKYFDGIGVKQYILSASERVILEKQLKRVGIDGYFEDILCLDNIYADSKLDIALEFFKSFEGDKSECLMIGDTTHDAQVAQGAGIDCILIACGHMSRQRLEKTGYPVLDDMASLIKQAPVAVIDSGVGGISVLRELIKLMPNENYIYFADSKNAPYGTKSRTEVLDIMLDNTEKLLDMGAKAIVVACNTATSAAVRVMREKYPELPIVGIEPAIKPAASVCEHPTVVVMATPLTLHEEKFQALKDRFAHDEDIVSLPCPGLMEIIESGYTDGDVVDEYIRNIFEPLNDKKIDAVVLGCTHYPFVKGAVEKHLGGSVKIFDGGHGTAKEVMRRIQAAELQNLANPSPEIEFISSNGDEKVTELCKRLLAGKESP